MIINLFCINYFLGVAYPVKVLDYVENGYMFLYICTEDAKAGTYTEVGTLLTRTLEVNSTNWFRFRAWIVELLNGLKPDFGIIPYNDCPK